MMVGSGIKVGRMCIWTRAVLADWYRSRDSLDFANRLVYGYYTRRGNGESNWLSPSPRTGSGAISGGIEV